MDLHIVDVFDETPDHSRNVKNLEKIAISNPQTYRNRSIREI